MRKNAIITKKFTYLEEREPKVILKREKSKHSGGKTPWINWNPSKGQMKDFAKSIKPLGVSKKLFG